MGKTNDNGFHLNLDGVKLSEESRNRIQAGIREVVLRELAGYPDPDGNPPGNNFGDGILVIPPRFWRGYILRELSPAEGGEPIRNVEGLKNSAGYVFEAGEQ